MIRKGERGQALVLVLLSLSVVLTLVLFILSRSITDVAVSSGQEAAVRAFSAAEAGIERSLVVGTGFSLTDIGNASYTTTVTDFALGGSDIPFPSPVSYGDTVTAWFVSHNASGNPSCSSLPCFYGNNPSVKVCWGNPGTSGNSPTTPAIELSVYYESSPGDLATIKIGRTAVDPNAGRRASNNFVASDGSCQIGDQNYAFSKIITFASLIPDASYQNANGLQLAKIRILYNTGTPHSAGISVAGGTTLPSQGQKIDSSGAAGDSNRRIVVYRGWAESPYFSNSVISPVGITQ